MNNNPTHTVFFHKISEKIKKGDYDVHFTIPFMSKDLLISSIKVKLAKKITKGNTPVLTDSEIMLCIQEIKETAACIFKLYVDNDILERYDDGTYGLSKKGKLALRSNSILFMLK